MSRERVVEAPSAAELVRKEVLQDEEDGNQLECTEDGTPAKRGDTTGIENCIIDRKVDHSNEDEKWRFRVRWYKFACTDDTWEAIDGLPLSSVRRYLKKMRRSKWPPPKILDRAVVG